MLVFRHSDRGQGMGIEVVPVGGLPRRRWLAVAGIWLGALASATALISCGAAPDAPDDAPEEEPAAAPAMAEITIYAGSGSAKFNGDGGPALSSGIYAPTGLALDKEGNLYISTEKRVRKVEAQSGIISTIAGGGSTSAPGDDGPALAAGFRDPRGLAVDGRGNVLIADHGNSRVRRVDAATGIITTIAGGGIADRLSRKVGDGGPATEALVREPMDVVLDSRGNIYIVSNHRVRKVDAATGVISTIVGNGSRGLSGDGGPAVDAQIAGPNGIAVDGTDNVFIADTENHRVRRIDADTGLIATLAGIGTYKDERNCEGCRAGSGTGGWSMIGGIGAGYSGDGGPATAAELRLPESVAVGPQGNLYIADGGIIVRKVDVATGVISTVAAGETVASSETGVVRVHTATLGDIASLVVNGIGEIFLADVKRNFIHKVPPAESP